MNVLWIATRALPTLVAALLLAVLTSPVQGRAPVGTGFTYQGQLREAGNPANGTYNMSFSLWNASVGGSQVGGTLTFPAQSVTDGLFTVTLDFGASNVDGEALWLQIVVNGTPLTPRQPLTAAPYAVQTRGIFTNQAASFTGIGRKSAITANEVFGVRRNSADFGGIYVETANGGMPFYGYSTDGSVDAYHYYSDNASQWRLNIGNGDRLFVSPNGNTGIGVASPAYRLDVAGRMRVHGSGGASAGIWFRDIANTSDRSLIGRLSDADAATGIWDGDSWAFRINDNTGLAQFDSEIRVQSPTATGITRLGDFVPFSFPGRLYVSQQGENVAVFNRTGNDGLLLIFQRDGSSKGSISVSGETVSYNAFTGSHYGWTERAIEPGTLVRLTGNNLRLHNDADSEIVYGIEPTATANDPACLGAYLAPEEQSRVADSGNPHLVMAVGNGFMWVVENSSGDIVPGDYLISSDVPGCAMKDDTARFAIGHIIARAGERVNWSDVQPDADGVRRAKVSVLFDSFARNSEASRLAELVEAQQRELDAMRERLASIEEVHIRLAELEARLGQDAVAQVARHLEVNQ